MDPIGIGSVIGGALLYMACAFLTFNILEHGKSNPAAALYIIVKGVVLGLVCGFVPPLLMLVNAARAGADQITLINALVAGFTLVLPLVFLIVVFQGKSKVAKPNKTTT